MKTRFFLLLLLAFSCDKSFAAISITSASTSSPTITRMGQFTIAVTGHGSKSPVPPLAWADFEGNTINPSSLGQITSWDLKDGMAVVSSRTTSDGSTYAAEGTWKYDGINFDKTLAARYDTHFTTAVLIMNRYYSYSLLDNDKEFRINQDAGSNDFVCSSVSGGACLNEAFTGNVQYGGNPNSPGHNLEEWDFTHGDNSAAQTSNGTLTFTSNGRLIKNHTNFNNGGNTLYQLVADNLASSGSDYPADGEYVLMDNIYMDTTFSAVFITTMSTWGTSTCKWPQIPATWDATSITARFNVPSTDIGKTLYAYVRDAQNNVNSSGVQVTTSGTSLKSSTCPCR